MLSDRNRRPTEARTSGSSSMTKTVEFASGITATRIKGSLKEAFVSVRRFGPAVVLVPIPGPEQPYSSPHARRRSKFTLSLCAPIVLDGIFGAQFRHFAPEINQSLRG